MMRLGCRGSLKQHRLISRAGFDFLQVDAQIVLRGEESSRMWERSVPDLSKLAIPVEVADHLVPADWSIIGPQRDPVRLQSYMQRVAKRAEQLGIGCLVFDGGPLHWPETVDRQTAWIHLEQFTQMAGQVCAHHGVTLAIRPLSASATAMMMTLDRTRHLCEHVEHPNVGVLVDSDHFRQQDLPDDAVLGLHDHLKHVHICEPDIALLATMHSKYGTNRSETPPGLLADMLDLDYIVCVLRKAGYRERITVAAREPGPPPEAWVWVPLLRRVWNESARSDG